MRRRSIALLAVLALVSTLLAGNLAPARAQAEASSGQADLRLLAPSSPLEAKARINIFLEVLNLGPGTASNLSVHVDPGDAGGLVIVGQAERGLRRLAANDSDLLVVRVATPAQAGGAALAVTFGYEDDAGVRQSVTRTVGLQIAVPASAPLEASLDPTVVETGRPSNVTLTLVNPTDRAVKNLDVAVSARTQQSLVQSPTPDLTPGATSSVVVQGGVLGAQGTARILVPLLASLTADDLLSLTFTVRYSVDGFDREQVFEFGVRAVGTVLVRVLQAREVAVGGGMEVAATIVNAGTATAWNPRVSVAEGSGLVQRSATLVEDLKPREAATVRLPVERIAPARPGAPLLSIEWDDEYGVTETTTASGILTPLAVPPPTVFQRIMNALGSFWVVLLIGAIAAIGLAISLTHAVHARAAQREAEAEEADAVQADTREKDRRRQGRHKQRPKPG